MEINESEALRILENKFSLLLGNHIEQIINEVYTPKIFISMIGRHGKLGAVKELLGSREIKSGFERLLIDKRPDLTIEAFVLSNRQFYPLFTDVMLSNAQYKLEILHSKFLEKWKKEYEFDFKA